jgi:hypothetical protein
LPNPDSPTADGERIQPPRATHARLDGFERIDPDRNDGRTTPRKGFSPYRLYRRRESNDETAPDSSQDAEMYVKDGEGDPRMIDTSRSEERLATDDDSFQIVGPGSTGCSLSSAWVSWSSSSRPSPRSASARS